MEAFPEKLVQVKLNSSCTQPGSSKFLTKVKNDILSYLKGKRVTFNYTLDTSLLTSSQRKMLKELPKIPYGKTISYKELARKLSTSPRACGRLLAGNPFPIIIPCHRVIYATGKLGGFSGGLNWKKSLLTLEKKHALAE